MTKRIAIFFLTCVLAQGAACRRWPRRLPPRLFPGRRRKRQAATQNNTVETFPENNTDSNISGKSTPAYYPYQIATVPTAARR